jgi:peptide/nickel transport system permease protein
MIGFIIRRIGQAVIVVLGVTVITFTLEHLLPGSIARAIEGPRADAVQLAAFNKANGLDRSLPYQYVHYLDQLVHGNLGFSFIEDRTVTSLLSNELPRDLVLVGLSLFFSLLIAIPVGVLQAVKRNGIADYVGTSVSFLLYSMPAYALGLLMIDLLSVRVHLLPSEAPQQATWLGLLEHPIGLIQPVICLTAITYALFSRYMRSTAIESLAQDYIRTARAKGLSERAILWGHLLRNSLIPIATLVGLSIPGILTAGLIVEQVFNFPGLGLQYFNSALKEDYQTELSITLLVGLATVLGNLVADIAYAVLDPRVRYD